MPISVLDKDGAPQTIATIDDLIALSVATEAKQDDILAAITALNAGLPVLDGVGGAVVTFSAPGINTEDASDPVVISSDQLALDAVTLPDGSGSGANAVLFSIDATGYRWINALCKANGSGNTIRFQGSNNNTDWSTVASLNAADGSGTWTSAHGPSVGTSYSCPVTHKYMRMIISAAGSGTVTVTPVLFNAPLFPPMQDSVAPKLAARSSNIPTASNGSSLTPITTLDGKQVVRPFSLSETEWVQAGLTLTTSDQALIAGLASNRNFLTWLLITTGATWTENTLRVRDGTTNILTPLLPAGAHVHMIPLPAGLLKSTVAAALNVQAAGAVTGTCIVMAGGYQAAA